LKVELSDIELKFVILIRLNSNPVNCSIRADYRDTVVYRPKKRVLIYDESNFDVCSGDNYHNTALKRNSY